MLELKSPSLRAVFSPLGARLVSVFFDGDDMLMGGGTDEQILASDYTAGAVCGRVAGRITKSRVKIDGVTHELAANLGENQLHGGPDNFAQRNWKAEAKDNWVRFIIVSPDGDQGYPGEVTASATYTLSGGTLALDLEARTTRPTVINLTNHAYWNLSGGKRAAFAHEMLIAASGFLPLDGNLMPLGFVAPVAGTRWDFRNWREVAENYDNCWALDGPRGVLKRGLVLRDHASGRRMEVWATEAGMQMYTSWHWNEQMPGRSGPLKQYAAIAIEPQNFPDAPTHANFPSALLRPGETYRSRIEWRFLK
jgi:aldose 1-epimerase